jgi:hypothetical protein
MTRMQWRIVVMRAPLFGSYSPQYGIGAVIDVDLSQDQTY